MLVGDLQGQMINYDRLERKKTIPEKRSLRKKEKKEDQADLPGWMKETPKVTNVVERRYDSNRDLKLQTFEVKILLRDVLDVVEDKGGYTVNSDILKEYDVNKDGLITRTEAVKLKKDAYRRR